MKPRLLTASAKPAAARNAAPSRARTRNAAPHPTLSLVPAAIPLERPKSHSQLALWHLLSLDAPTVASLWVWFTARCCGLALPWSSTVAMFVAVWMLYAADRLLDARPLSHGLAPHQLEERHRFHHRHRRRFLAAIGGASVALACLLPRLDPRALRLYAILASLLFAYFFLIHIAPTSAGAPRMPKELAVGLFFPAAIFIPTVARSPALRLALAPGALCFAAVCTLNCLYLYAWEHPGARLHAHWTTRFATGHLRALSGLAALCAAIFALAQSRSPTRPAHLYLLPLAACLSLLLLLALDAVRARFSAIHLRAAADCALLTPLLLLPLLYATAR